MRCEAVLKMFGLQTIKREPPYDRLADWFASNADLKLFEELYL
jgi:hypothetical protein